MHIRVVCMLKYETEDANFVQVASDRAHQPSMNKEPHTEYDPNQIVICDPWHVFILYLSLPSSDMYLQRNQNEIFDVKDLNTHTQTRPKQYS